MSCPPRSTSRHGRRLDWRKGERLRQVPSAQARGPDREPAGQVLTIGDRRMRADRSGVGKGGTLVADRTRGTLGARRRTRRRRVYVSDHSRAMQVKVVSPEGTPLARSDAGRPSGWAGADPEGMLRPARLTVDADGKVWVPELGTTRARIATRGRRGELAADLLGPSSYAVMAPPSPRVRALGERPLHAVRREATGRERQEPGDPDPSGVGGMRTRRRTAWSVSAHLTPSRPWPDILVSARTPTSWIIYLLDDQTLRPRPWRL